MNENEKHNEKIDIIKKVIERIYNTTSLKQESNAIEELIKLVKEVEIEDLIEFIENANVFEKCVLHYKLPFEYRLNVDFVKASRVDEFDRLNFWKEYKNKLNKSKFNPEEIYNKMIMMACILHVPINDEENNEN